MFKIKNEYIATGKEYLKHERSKVTTTIRTDYIDEFKKLMDAIGVDYCKGYDVLLELLSEDEKLLDKFIKRVKEY